MEPVKPEASFGVKSLVQTVADKIYRDARAFLIQDNLSFCCRNQNSVFAKLPQGVLKEIVNALPERFNKAEHLCLLLQMLHPSTRHFDYLKYSARFQTSPAVFFKHLLQNCPNICHIKVTAEVYNDYAVIPRGRLDDLFRIMGVKWQNLQHLYIEDLELKPGKCNGCVKSICTSLRNLRELHLTVPLEHMDEGIGSYVSSMAHLEIFDIKFTTSKKINRTQAAKDPDPVVCTILGTIAVKSPKLKRLSFECEKETWNCGWLVNIIAEHPLVGKTLHVPLMRISKDDIVEQWPACLTFDELEIGDRNRVQPDAGFLHLFTIKAPVKKLTLTNLHPSFIYASVKRFGAHLEHLIIQSSHGAPIPLDVCRVLSHCPVFETVNISGIKTFVPKPNEKSFKDAPINFQQCTGFYIYSHIDADQSDSDPEVYRLHRMHLLTTKRRITRLICHTPVLLRVISSMMREILPENPFQNVEDVYFKIPNEPDNNFLAMVFEVASELLKKAPNLKNMYFYVLYPPEQPYFWEVPSRLQKECDSFNVVVNAPFSMENIQEALPKLAHLTISFTLHEAFLQNVMDQRQPVPPEPYIIDDEEVDNGDFQLMETD